MCVCVCVLCVSRSVFSDPFVTPRDCSPPGSSIPGILQARILEYIAPPVGGLLDPGVELRSPALQAGSLPSEPPGKPIVNWY